MALDRIFSRYNGDFDINPDGPVVTWAEFELAHTVQKLIARVEALEAQIAAQQSVQSDVCQFCACIPPLADTNSMGKCEACGCARR